MKTLTKNRVISDLFSGERYSVQSTNIDVNWGWYDESQGLVEWTFTNIGNVQASVILLRNGYYFGGAFWPVYEANPGFDTQFLQTVAPLVDNGVANNSPPLALIDLGGLYSVAFVFTLAPGQIWSMLEGGFSQLMTPSQVVAYEVAQESIGQFCIGYDPNRVVDWDTQTGTNLQGYSPNPSTFSTVLFNTESAPVDLLPFTDSIVTGACQNPAPQPPPPTGAQCITQIEKGVSEIQSGQIEQGASDIITGIDCLIQTGYLRERIALKAIESVVKKWL